MNNKIQSSDLTKGGSNQLFTGNSAKVLLTVNLGGKLMGNMSKKLNKAELSKVKTSPFERANPSGKGYITPSNLYLSPSDHEDRPVGVACRKSTISETSYNSMISEKIPEDYYKNREGRSWVHLSKKQRLEWFLSRIAEGNEFSYELID